MSKAKELAEKAYPEGDTYIFGDASIACQVAYVKGYHQAEKDNELTWEDMVLFRTLFDATDANIRSGSIKIQPMTKEYYQEVLERYNKERKEL